MRDDRRQESRGRSKRLFFFYVNNFRLPYVRHYAKHDKRFDLLRLRLFEHWLIPTNPYCSPVQTADIGSRRRDGARSYFLDSKLDAIYASVRLETVKAKRKGSHVHVTRSFSSSPLTVGQDSKWIQVIALGSSSPGFNSNNDIRIIFRLKLEYIFSVSIHWQSGRGQPQDSKLDRDADLSTGGSFRI